MPSKRLKQQNGRSASSSPLLTHLSETRNSQLDKKPPTFTLRGVENEMREDKSSSHLFLRTVLYCSKNDNKDSVSNSNNTEDYSNNRTRRNKKSKKEKISKENVDSFAGKNTLPISPTSSAIYDQFSAVEIFFQLAGEGQRGNIIFPRNVSDLLLWSVPFAVPLIESPKMFFIRNKSRLRDVVIIYVNGWTRDDMLYSAKTVGGCNYSENNLHSVTADVLHDDTSVNDSSFGNERIRCDGNATNNGQSKEKLIGRISRTMLQHIRTQQCWARKGCGVQSGPLFVPGAWGSVEDEIFWRNELPKTFLDEQRSAETSVNVLECGEPLTVAKKTARSATLPFGVGALFNRALSLHHSKAMPSAEAAAGATGDVHLSSSLPAIATASLAVEETVARAVDDDTRPSLWDDRQTLLKYALSPKENGDLLNKLSFVLDVPSDSVDAADWSSFDDVSFADVTGTPRVFALDCEMVLVANRVSALARITLVDVRTGAAVIDTLVNPETEVLDYLTRYSGVSKEMLDGVKTTLRDCQQEMKRYINSETFVVGHSLDNDFKACKMLPNCYILDTAYLYPHPAGLPSKNALRFLAMRYLQKRIQQGSHNSLEDASVSAELAYLKMLNGPSFAVRKRVSLLEVIETAALETSSSKTTTQEKTDANKTNTEEKADYAKPISAKKTTLGIRLNLFDDACLLRDIIPPITNGYKGTLLQAVPVRNDKDAVRKAVRYLRRRQNDVNKAVEGESTTFALTWMRLTETVVRDAVVLCSDCTKNSNNNNNNNDGGGACGEVQQIEQESGGDDVGADDHMDNSGEPSWGELQLERVNETNRRVMQVIHAVPNNSLVLVFAAGTSPAIVEAVSTEKTRGVCFAFVKDITSPGPPTAWLGGEDSLENVGCEETLKTPPACQQQ